jgi:3-methyladenine DNA glycosylase AlkD
MSKESDFLAVLQALAKPENVEGMRHFGMLGENRLGIAIPELRRLAKEHGKDHAMALSLWHSGIPEARILASMIEDPQEVSVYQVEEWVSGFNSWDVCDQVCMNLLEKVPSAVARIPAWAAREEEFVRRTAFSLMACLAWHDKKASNDSFIAYFPLIKQAAVDERNFVKKAVNWALRNIGKRNPALNQAAISLAEDLQRMDSKSARWIAADALRELHSDAVQKRIHEKPIL